MRKLLNAVERALATSHYDHNLFPKHLPPHIRIQIARASVSKKNITAPTPSEDTGLEIYRTIDSFSHKLRQLAKDLSLAVIYAPRKEDLRDIIIICSIFNITLYFIIHIL
ncbi:MAG: hypothetical protein KAQ81_01995 [Deltaproteobacteria bacterium]|nr:hypothetical protein [Deltaproteobacteria bacterium]